MAEESLIVVRYLLHSEGPPVHAVALAEDGVHLLAGTEHDLKLLDRFGRQRFRYFEPPAPGTKFERDMPFRAVALAPGLGWGLAGRRTGQVYRLDLSWRGEDVDVWPQEIRCEANDLYSLSLAADQRLIALGHLGPALTVIDTEGRQHWRRHPDDRNPTDAKTWAVAFGLDGNTLFVGSSGAERNVLAALDATTGTKKTALRPKGRVMALAPLAPPLGVLAQLSESDGSRLVAYPADLKDEAWEFRPRMSGRITAIATDVANGLTALGTTTGHLALLEAGTGHLLAENRTLGSTVLSIAVAGGRYVAAGLQDGQIAYLEYSPAREEEIEV